MRLHIGIFLLCLAGFFLSSYAYSVEMRMEHAKQFGQEFRAACDIGPFSCTKVFSSDFGSATQFFGLPKTSNAVVGMGFYLVEMCCSWSPVLMLFLSTASVLATVCLAFILTVVLRDLCVVCCSIYVVNICTFVLAYRWWRRSPVKGRCILSSSSKNKMKAA